LNSRSSLVCCLDHIILLLLKFARHVRLLKDELVVCLLCQEIRHLPGCRKNAAVKVGDEKVVGCLTYALVRWPLLHEASRGAIVLPTSATSQDGPEFAALTARGRDLWIAGRFVGPLNQSVALLHLHEKVELALNSSLRLGEPRIDFKAVLHERIGPFTSCLRFRPSFSVFPLTVAHFVPASVLLILTPHVREPHRLKRVHLLFKIVHSPWKYESPSAILCGPVFDLCSSFFFFASQLKMPEGSRSRRRSNE
jgi:hypothetical protein